MDTVLSPGALTLDVEDWDHANYSQLRNKSELIHLSVRESKYAMDSNIDLWLQLLEEVGAQSTCFVLGDFARRFPDSIRRLARAGHEIASHGLQHDLIYEMSRLQFRESLKQSLGILGDLVGNSPKGFRAPSWSVDERTPWFCEELEAQRILYDSSVLPFRNLPVRPFWEGKVLRVPVSVFEVGPLRIPFSSGVFFRLMPFKVIQYGFRRAALNRRTPMIVLHPRELDPLHPRLPLSGWRKSIHYANLQSTLPKLKSLLKEGQWTSLFRLYGSKFDNPTMRLDN